MLYLFFIKNSNRNVIVGASTLTAGNIKKGVKIFNVTGTFTGWVDNSIVMFQNGTLVQNSNLGGTVTYNAGTWWGIMEVGLLVEDLGHKVPILY